MRPRTNLNSRGQSIMRRYDLARMTRGGAKVALPVIAALFLGSCSTDQLLEVNTPDQITVNTTQSISGAQAQRVAGIGLFGRFFGADLGGGGVSLNVTTAILTDEAYTARSGTGHLDSRSQNPNSFPANAPWGPFGDAHNGIVR